LCSVDGKSRWRRTGGVPLRFVPTVVAGIVLYSYERRVYLLYNNNYVYILLYERIMFSYNVSSPRIFFINRRRSVMLEGDRDCYNIYYICVIIILYTRSPVKYSIWVRHPLGPGITPHPIPSSYVSFNQIKCVPYGWRWWW